MEGSLDSARERIQNPAENSTNLDFQKIASVSGKRWYEVEYTEEGVFLNLYYKANAGSQLKPELVLYDLQRRGLSLQNPGNVVLRMRTGDTRIKLCESRPENDADLDVFITTTRDEMTAYLQLLPACGAGGVKDIESIRKEIEQRYGIVYNLNIESIISAIERGRYFEPIVIAEGRPPQKGKDGFLTFLFNTEHDFAPKLLEDGSADYKELNMFADTAKGDVLVVSVPPEDGIDGVTVKGAAVAAQRGKEAPLPAGKNVVVSEDGRNLVAAKSGRVDYVNGRVEVSDTYMVRGNMDMGIGNIDFAGDVTVMGNVISGLTLKAQGDVEVHGLVEAATVIAGGNIVIKGGMQGMDKGVLQAGGSVISRFIERSAVEAGESVYSDYIAHSSVTAQDSVVMKGRRAKIIGGLTRAGRQISARTIGSPSGDKTVIEIGISPKRRQVLIMLEEERSQLKSQLEKVSNFTRISPSRNESAERVAMRQKLIETYENLSAQMEELNAKIEQAKQELMTFSDGKVHASVEAYQDVKITIDFATFTTRSSIKFVTFKYQNGEVVFTSCEETPEGR